MKNIIQFLRKNDIGEPPWGYYFLKNLPKSEYPKYLAKIFNYRTGEKLPLKYDFKNKSWIIDKKRCKTFNQKIQWLKLYGITDLMRKCTDKVLVRDYVAEKIGEEYLKPVLQIIPSLNCDCHVIARNNSTLGDEAIREERSQLAMNKNAEDKQLKSGLDCHVAIAPRNDRQLNDVSTYFDQIDFDKLPNAFVIKCNHGCKWHCIVKDKNKLLLNEKIIEKVKNKITGWLEQDYSFWGGFEMQYATSTLRVRTRLSEGNVNDRTKSEVNNLPERKGCQDKNRGIEPKILIEPFIQAKRYIEIYCFNGIPKIYVDIHIEGDLKICTYNKDFSYSDLVLKDEDKEFMCKINADKILKQTVDLSKKLAECFKFVRSDWILFEDNLYFEELTFTPYSGFSQFDKKWNKKLGNWIGI